MRAGDGTGAVEGSLGEERNESVKSKDRVGPGTPLGSVNMQSAQLPQATEFKYMGSTLQSDCDMITEVNKRTQCGWNNWRKMYGVLYATREYHHT